MWRNQAPHALLVEKYNAIRHSYRQCLNSFKTYCYHIHEMKRKHTQTALSTTDYSSMAHSTPKLRGAGAMDQLISVCFESLIPRAYIKSKGKWRGVQDSNSVL